MEVKIPENVRQFVAIEYPGKVVNEEKMIETFGGVEELSKSIIEKQKLQLKFRPNFYAKPALSTEPQEASGMLIKVRVRKSRKDREKKPELVAAELIGTIATSYKFNNFADYQFLPIQKNEQTGKSENIYNDIVPSDITQGPAWLREKTDVPIFLPPVAFTRTDTMQATLLKNEKVDTKDERGDQNASFAVTNRSSRSCNGISVPFSMTDEIPTKPSEKVKDLVKNKFLTQEEYDEVFKLFQDRPIWTLAALRANMRLPPRRLNFLLADIAFYYSTGPWRNGFVRFGYDPRTDFESRHYQMLDYRVRQLGFKGEIEARRGTGVNKRVKVPTKYESNILNDEEVEENLQKRKLEAIFNCDTIPPYRARHYQFADVHIPKIQEMLHKLPTPMSGTLCHEKRGWLPSGFVETCRDILATIAQANMQVHCAEKNISLDEFKAAEDSKLEGQADDFDAEDMDSEGDEPIQGDEPMQGVEEAGE